MKLPSNPTIMEMTQKLKRQVYISREGSLNVRIILPLQKVIDMSKQQQILQLINYQIASIDGAIDGLSDILPATDFIARSDLVNMTKQDRKSF